MATERIVFRHLHMHRCCGTLLCWVNPRLPSYCPECGVQCISHIRECVTTRDEGATIRYSPETVGHGQS